MPCSVACCSTSSFSRWMFCASAATPCIACAGGVVPGAGGVYMSALTRIFCCGRYASGIGPMCVDPRGGKGVAATVHDRGREQIVDTLDAPIRSLGDHEPTTSGKLSQIAGNGPIEGPEHDSKWAGGRTSCVLNGRPYDGMSEVENLTLIDVSRIANDGHKAVAVAF